MVRFSHRNSKSEIPIPCCFLAKTKRRGQDRPASPARLGGHGNFDVTPVFSFALQNYGARREDSARALYHNGTGRAQQVPILFDIIFSLGSGRIKFIKLFDYVFGLLIAKIVPARKITSLPRSFKAQSILIIRPGGIGDAIFLLPILKQIKQKQPDLKVDVLCEKRNYEIFASQRNLYRTIYCYNHLKSFLSVFHNHYDVIIDTEQWHYLSALTAYFLKSKMTIGFATRPLRAKLFTHRVNYGLDTYELENFKALFQPFLGTCPDVENINSCYTLSDSLLDWAQQTIPTSSVSLFLGGSIPPRRLTKEQAMNIIRYIFGKNQSVVLLGGQDVSKMGEMLGKECEDNQLLNFAGKISLGQSAALIKQSKLFIGTDSGLMHLACAVGTPVIGIFGPGNLAKWHPKGDRHAVVSENVPCSPCTRFGYTVPTCKGGYECMSKIQLQKIYSILGKLLK